MYPEMKKSDTGGFLDDLGAPVYNHRNMDRWRVVLIVIVSFLFISTSFNLVKNFSVALYSDRPACYFLAMNLRWIATDVLYPVIILLLLRRNPWSWALLFSQPLLTALRFLQLSRFIWAGTFRFPFTFMIGLSLAIELFLLVFLPLRPARRYLGVMAVHVVTAFMIVAGMYCLTYLPGWFIDHYF